MPMPVSTTLTLAACSAADTTHRTVPPWGEYLMAFSSRLLMMVRIRPTSPKTVTARGGISSDSW